MISDSKVLQHRQPNAPETISNAKFPNLVPANQNFVYFPTNILLSNFKDLFGNHYAATFSTQWDSATD